MNALFAPPVFQLRAHRDAECVATFELPFDTNGDHAIDALGARWRVQTRVEGADHVADITLQAGAPGPVSIGLVLPLPDWSEQVYTVLPGAVYAGNRFDCRPVPYSPRYPAADAGARARPLVTDLPRLSSEAGQASCLQLLTRDLAFPAFVTRWPDGRALMVTTPSPDPLTLWEVVENAAHDHARLGVCTPGVRRTRYSFHQTIRTDAACEDRGRVLAPGERLRLRVRIEVFHAPDLAAVADRLGEFADTLLRAVVPRHELPLSAAADLVEAKRNREDWNEALCLYHTTNLSAGQSHNVFQTGWCGGVIAESALLAGRQTVSRSRATRSLSHFAARAPRNSGWVAGKAHADGSWTADFVHDAARPWTHRWTLLRRQADALWFLLAACDRHEALGIGPAPSAWFAAARGLARAFAAAVDSPGFPGQFIDIDTGEVMVGGSASAALAPAALLAASRRLGEPALVAAATRLGLYLYDHYTRRGLSTGGPADALQAPDSESAAGLLESFLALHEAGAPGADWLSHARAAGAWLCTWIMPWDCPFPEGSEFARLRIPASGGVLANAQNKHSAPGLCTHSGLSLLRLFRHAGDARPLHALAAVTRCLPWCVSRPDRPVHDSTGRPLPPGWINERINISDWDHNLGGVFYGSTWSEVALLLAAMELPSVYAQPDTGLLVCLDHLEAAWIDAHHAVLRLSNPTRFPARVRLLIETSAEARARPIGPASALGWPVFELAPGESRTWPA